ncbi:MAG: hypothetical protein ACLFV3_07010 [Phycisphaeraceae bacterium]
MQHDRLASVLLEKNLLSQDQARELLDRTGSRPSQFGQVAAELVGLSEHDLWTRLADATLDRWPLTSLIFERFDYDCLDELTPETAWDNLVLPLRRENDELVCATTEETLADAMRLTQGRPVSFVICEMRPLEQFIAERYSYEGVDLAG